jgi:hypothetical protein
LRAARLRQRRAGANCLQEIAATHGALCITRALYRALALITPEGRSRATFLARPA